MPTINIPTIDLSTFKLPFDLPRVDVPSFDLPEVDLPSAEQLSGWFRDAVLAGTGLVALTAERVADLQRQFVEVVTAQLKR